MLLNVIYLSFWAQILILWYEQNQKYCMNLKICVYLERGEKI